jgi:hypothetical protein
MSGSAGSAGAAGALDLHGAIGDPPPQLGGCQRSKWWLLSSQGELVRCRCKASNLCGYCARLKAVETSEMLLLDAGEVAPAVYAVLTARELLSRSECRDHLRQLRKALKKRWRSIEWAVLVEFQRRGALHLNLLVKGVGVDDVDELRARVVERWCDRVDAEPQAQFVGVISDGPGLVRYIALHFLKPDQAPPVGWRGHRWSYTRGYLVRPAGELREEARASLRYKRELWRAAGEGLVGLEAEIVAEAAVALSEATSWQLFVRRAPAPAA